MLPNTNLITCLQRPDDRDSQPIEQLGTYDPMPNTENQKLISLNLERIQHWIGRGAIPSGAVREVFGKQLIISICMLLS